VATRNDRSAIAIVMPLAEQRGGAERLLQLLLERRAGDDLVLPTFDLAFLSDGPMAAEARRWGYSVTVIEAYRLRHAVTYMRTVRALRNWLARSEPQVVVSWMAKAHFYVSPAAQGLGIPRLWYQHGISGGGWLDRLATALPGEGVLACSAAVARAQARLRPRRKTRVVYPAVALSPTALDGGSARDALGVARGVPVVLMVSRLERGKGIHIAVQAAAIVLARRPDAIFIHVGGAHGLDPGYAGEVRKAVSGRGLDTHWRWLGQLPPEDVAVWLRAADVFLHPNVGPEAFGMAVVEAMAAGLSVVASAIGGPTEIITQGVDGLLVPPGNAAALAKTLIELLEDAPRRKALGSAALVRAKDYDADRFPARFVDALAQLVPRLGSTETGPITQ